LNEVKMSSN